MLIYPGFFAVRYQIMTELDIVHQEATFVVVNKPSGLLSVPGRGPDMQDCVVNRLKALFSECIEQPSVHRLDMDTSGLQVLALTKEAQRNLSIQFQKHQVEKTYIAILQGILDTDTGKIELAFRLDPENRPHQVYDPVLGKVGVTSWRKLGVKNGCTRVEFKPLTGRTHQLRLHAASEHGLGYPIVGDRLYGTGTGPGQLQLHAAYLSFAHPESGQRVEFSTIPGF
jgi:tRNA pseudouridine32 synthase/23S rRNA pseudouridine746 synthase